LRGGIFSRVKPPGSSPGRLVAHTLPSRDKVKIHAEEAGWLALPRYAATTEERSGRLRIRRRDELLSRGRSGIAMLQAHAMAAIWRQRGSA